MARAKRGGGGTGRSGGPGYSTGDYAIPAIPDYVVVELEQTAPVMAAAAGFAPTPGARSASANPLNKILGDFAVKSVSRHLPPSLVFAPQVGGPAMGFGMAGEIGFPMAGDPLGRFVEIVPRKSTDAHALAARLNRSKMVASSYVEPRPEPASRVRTRRTSPRGAATPDGTTPASLLNFEPTQGYLHDAPNGIGAMAVWNLPGGKGRGVTICDIEGNWNLTHADFPAGIPLLGGTVINTQSWIDHGTAVLGEMISLSNQHGTVGIAHEASAAVHSAVVGGVFNTAAAIITASNVLGPGDVILIELHAPGPNGNYVAMQYWPAIFAAIQVAVAKGIVVVEAAGNGGENFDAAIYNGSGLQQDSGAILVGAGAPPTNYFDVNGFGSQFPPYSPLGPPRSRLWFSNYGDQVNVQGWGWHVTTTGYGDLQGGESQNDWFTARFSGTSSASPIVAAAAASLQAMAIARTGSPLTPARVRDILISTGTPQQAGPSSPLSQKIGPLPNLAEASTQI